VVLALGGCDRRSSPVAPPAPAPVVPVVVEVKPEPPPPPPAPPQILDIKVARVAKNKTLAVTLNDMGVGVDELKSVTAALEGVFNFKKVRAGDQVRLSRQDGRIETIEIRRSELDEWTVRREGERLVGAKRAVEVETRRATVDLAVRSSLWEAMSEAGENPNLAGEIADVLAWDIDFYRDVRKGDKIRVIVDKDFVHGRLLRYGQIYGVRYEGGSVGSKKLMRYTALSGETTFFDEKGTSAKKPFLKTPLKFVHITSHFGGRTNPLSGYHQEHLGLDLQAEPGTPVWAVGDGVVTHVVYNDPGGGNYLFLRHANGYETGYLHLSRFADGIHPGVRVAQKQVIAFTGSTGMSTGPHLHYAVKKGGYFMNPLAVKLPRAEPLSAKELPRFQEKTAELSSLINAELVATLVPREE